MCKTVTEALELILKHNHFKWKIPWHCFFGKLYICEASCTKAVPQMYLSTKFLKIKLAILRGHMYLGILHKCDINNFFPILDYLGWICIFICLPILIHLCLHEWSVFASINPVPFVANQARSSPTSRSSNAATNQVQPRITSYGHLNTWQKLKECLNQSEPFYWLS